MGDTEQTPGKRPKPPRKAITVKLPVDLLEEVHAQREADGRSLTEFVRRSLASAVDFRRQHAPLPQALRHGRGGR